jgi:hypothetical protein
MAAAAIACQVSHQLFVAVPYRGRSGVGGDGERWGAMGSDGMRPCSSAQLSLGGSRGASSKKMVQISCYKMMCLCQRFTDALHPRLAQFTIPLQPTAALP